MNKIEESKELLRASGALYPEDEDTQGVVLNMNDVWAWAMSHGEPVSDDEVVEVARLFRLYGDCGLFYWVSEKHEGMRSEFKDINRFVEFVRNEEKLRKEVPESSKRAYQNLTYTLGE